MLKLLVVIKHNRLRHLIKFTGNNMTTRIDQTHMKRVTYIVKSFPDQYGLERVSVEDCFG